MYRRIAVFALAAVLHLAWMGWAQNPPPPEHVRFFETNIRPLLSARCYKCHGSDKERGGLRLDMRARLFKGGKSGPAIHPGDPEKSLLIKAVRHQDDDLKMPPEKALSETEIADLVRWVRMGAPYPPDSPSAKIDENPGEFWAFKPVGSPTMPTVKNTVWPSSPLDHFVLARLEANGLKPAARADPRTLIRRATFDLTGLPPTPDEIDAFLADCSPKAFAKVIDRLLASPAYGERWGRHWLDIVRYADSNNDSSSDDAFYTHAWRYRDYVVASFNQDKAYDRFVLEQLAGDLLPDDEHRCDGRTMADLQRHIATGFLALGPKALSEVDKKKLEMDIIDEQIDTLGRAFMGMTLGCARCHDHKVDPIEMNDYYGLAGIFKSTRTMEHSSYWLENSFPWPRDYPVKLNYDRTLAERRAELSAFVRQIDRDTVAAALRSPDKVATHVFAGFIQTGNGLPEANGLFAFLGDCLEKLVPSSPLWQIWLFVAISLPAGLGFIHWLRRTRYGEKLTAVLKYVAPAVLVGIIFIELTQDVSSLVELRFNPDPKQPPGLEPLYSRSAKHELQFLRIRVAQLEAHVPPLPKAMGAIEGQVVDVPIHLRGNHLELGKTIPRRVPRIGAGVAPPSFSAKESGRLELARWLVHADHPLTSRVMINRIWRWHFGKGIVRTPDNFGSLGERPDNPELLDWLARRFVADGWSIKAMHRTIMLSSTYQMISEPDTANVERDPENRLFGRANIRRLEAEAIRDAILAVTGTLERRTGEGLVLEEKLTLAPTKDIPIYRSRRRAIYLPVIRSNLYDMFQLFDFPSPSVSNGDRAITTVASQALLILNSAWVAELCESFADRILAIPDQDDAGRIRRVYLQAYGREPTGEDTAKSIHLIHDVERALVEREPDADARRRQAWAALCQVMIAANEFIYVK